MASCRLAGIAVVLGLMIHTSFEQVQFTENATFWTDGSYLTKYTETTWSWVTGGGDPQVRTLNFTDARKRLESVAFHYAWHLFVFIDGGTNTVFVYYPKTRAAGYAYVGTSPLVGHVAVDWLSNNIYWADAGFGWIGLQSLKENPGHLVTNGRLRVVVSTSLDRPYGVAVLPHIRRIFWTDYGTPPRLESADLLGDNRKPLVWQGLAKPTAISVDVATERVYWIDQWKETIESCDVNGADRRLVVYLKGSVLGGINLFDDYILFTTRDPGKIYAYNKRTGTAAVESFAVGVNTTDIAVFSSLSQPRANAKCSSSSCNHICIHSDQQPACVCSSGFILSSDGTTCQESVTSIWKSFLVSTASQICAVPLTLLYSHPYLLPDYIKRSIQCFLNGTDIRQLAVNSLNASVYYVSGSSVYVRHIHSGSVQMLYTGTNEIAGLAYDWAKSLVLWSERGSAHRIVSLAAGGSQPRPVYTGLVDPGSVAVDPRRGDIFWFEGSSGTSVSFRLYRGKVTGSETKVLLSDSSDFKQPLRLVFSHDENRLYWLDVDHVGSVTREGADKKKFDVSSVTARSGLTVFRGYVLWATGGTSANLTFRDVDLSLTDYPVVTFTLPGLPGVTDLAYYDANENSDDHCELDNGGCSQLCMNLGSSHVCDCRFGFKLQADGVSCTKESLRQNFFLVTDRLSSETYQIDSTGRSVWAAVSKDGGLPRHVTYNAVSREILWFDTDQKAIKISALNGTSVMVLRSFPNAVVTSLCVDSSSNTVYYVESSNLGNSGWIRVMPLIPPNKVHTLYSASTDPPKHLAISPTQGKLVFGTISGRIFLTDMTLENKRELTSQPVAGLSGLIFAKGGSTVVWSDNADDKITEVVHATGATTVLQSAAGNRPHSIVASGSNLYFLTHSGRTIKMLPESGKEELVAEFAEFGELTSLYFQGPATQYESSACSERNGRCSTLCIPAPSGRQCQCEDGVTLGADKRTCGNVETCPDAVPNGRLSDTCDRYPRDTCDYSCNEGYQKNTTVSSIYCTSVRWDVSTDLLCLKVSSHQENSFPGYAIGIVVAVAVSVVVLVVGCFLYRRLKRYGGRDSVRTGFDNVPVVFLTDTATINGAAKRIDDDNLSTTYDELAPVPDEVRYQSFSKISPRLGRLGSTSTRAPLGFNNMVCYGAGGFDEKGVTPYDKPYSGLPRADEDDEEEDMGSYVQPQSVFTAPRTPELAMRGGLRAHYLTALPPVSGMNGGPRVPNGSSGYTTQHLSVPQPHLGLWESNGVSGYVAMRPPVSVPNRVRSSSPMPDYLEPI